MNNNRRAYQGTIPALTPGVKVGQADFKIQPDGSAKFIDERNQLFEQLYAEAQKEQKLKPRADILIDLPSGKQLKGLSNEITPQNIVEELKLKNIILAKVKYSCEAPDTVVNALDELQDADSDTPVEDSDTKWRLWDLNQPLVGSCVIQFLKFEDTEAQHAFWHSSAHCLGLALEQVFGVQMTIGPALQNGFYYDFYAGHDFGVSTTNYPQIEEEFKKAVATTAPFLRLEVTKESAIQLFANNPFKLAIINSKVPDGSKTTVYKSGKFVDLCMGPHIPNFGYIKAFRVEKHSSTYWLGDAKGDTLQRVYGISFPDIKQLKEYIHRIEEAKKRDHRILGQQLNYFFFEPIYSPGSAFWTPDGTKVYMRLCELIRYQYRLRGFQEVHTPNICSSDLFKISGHWQNYKDCMFTMDVEGKQWALKPMNCPTHCCIFKHLNLSYKQLPFRMADFAVLHRNEFSGSLSGLTRVRRFQQDDAHIFCELHQVTQEVTDALEFLSYIYKIFGFTFKVQLATRPKKAMGDIKLWNKAEAALADALNNSGFSWTVNKGDGAFYGPKIDVKLYDALGRGHQCGTIQLDFQMPLRFDLQYKNADVAEAGEIEENEVAVKNLDGSLEQPLKPGYGRPVMIHRAILGSIERMAAVVMEHFGGKLPFWLSPRQAIVIPISEKTCKYASYVQSVLYRQGFDVCLDTSSNTVNKKVREASVQQWNYMLIVGETEEQNRTITIRNRDDPKIQTVKTLAEVLEMFNTLRDVVGVRQLQIPEYDPAI